MRYAYTSVPTAAVLNTELEKQLYDIFLVGKYLNYLVLWLLYCFDCFSHHFLYVSCITEILTRTPLLECIQCCF